jgi:predicted RNA-binding protein with PUA-like domain
VDIASVSKLTNPVTLGDIKRVPALKDMVLVNNSRLSVQPVREQEWKKILEMSGV